MCTVGFIDDNITVLEPMREEVSLEELVCVVRTGIIDRDILLLVVTQQRDDVPLIHQAIGIYSIAKMCTL